jgi:hypothetical protein
VRANEPKSNVYIPVAIDAEREVDGHPMVRVTYFVISSDAPAAVWQIDLPPLARLQGIGALGLLGVVFTTMHRSSPGVEADYEIFAQAADVAAIFTLESETPLLSVQIQDVWIPAGWFMNAESWDVSDPRATHRPERGDVYRVGLEVFQSAYRYTSFDITIDELLSTDWMGQIVYSPVETESFLEWAEDQIELTKRTFESKELKLRYREGQSVDA